MGPAQAADDRRQDVRRDQLAGGDANQSMRKRIAGLQKLGIAGPIAQA
jgi:hypothetical protein